MRDTTKKITRKLVPQIRALALRGQADYIWIEGRSDKYMYDGQEDIYWQTAGRFLLVYIESFGEDSYIYRLYRCSGEAWYDRRMVLSSALENGDFQCLFSYKETRDYKYFLYFHEGGIWYEDYEKAISAVFNET